MMLLHVYVAWIAFWQAMLKVPVRRCPAPRHYIRSPPGGSSVPRPAIGAFPFFIDKHMLCGFLRLLSNAGRAEVFVSV